MRSKSKVGLPVLKPMGSGEGPHSGQPFWRLVIPEKKGIGEGEEDALKLWTKTWVGHQNYSESYRVTPFRKKKGEMNGQGESRNPTANIKKLTDQAVTIMRRSKDKKKKGGGEPTYRWSQTAVESHKPAQHRGRKGAPRGDQKA